jgi:hypothetical protein
MFSSSLMTKRLAIVRTLSPMTGMGRRIERTADRQARQPAQPKSGVGR